jgi:urease accessory protein
MPSDASSVPFQTSGDLAHLRLLHLADSALPIGTLAHSFGLETLVSAEILQVRDLPEFLGDYLRESGMLEAVACRQAFQLMSADEQAFPFARWLAINDFVSAMKPARETRTAGAILGRNFLQLVMGLGEYPVLHAACEVCRNSETPIQQSAAFGLVSSVLHFEEDRAVLAYLHQIAACLVSACQRLLPLGQSEAARILWNLKPALAEVAARSASCILDTVHCVTQLLDWGSMEHPALATRLFIS